VQVSESDPRQRFFNEEGDCIPPFVDRTWRGCCLNRDRFDATMMPRFLFEAIIEATGSTNVQVAFYTPDQPEIAHVAAAWPAFRSAVYPPHNPSLEHVLFDTSGLWAVLGELDVMVLGAPLQSPIALMPLYHSTARAFAK
jgi:hypothetical protein